MDADDTDERKALAREIEAWLEQVDRELTPADPALALELVETLIRSDEALFACAGDSDGCIGDALRTACRLWLQTAARCEPPPGGWGERDYRAASDDGYGVREALLRHANLLLAILDGAYARAHGHAASYLGKLRQLAAELPPQHSLESHPAFEAALRAQHPRKTAFWSRFTAG